MGREGEHPVSASLAPIVPFGEETSPQSLVQVVSLSLGLTSKNPDDQHLSLTLPSRGSKERTAIWAHQSLHSVPWLKCLRLG